VRTARYDDWVRESKVCFWENRRYPLPLISGWRDRRLVRDSGTPRRNLRLLCGVWPGRTPVEGMGTLSVPSRPPPRSDGHGRVRWSCESPGSYPLSRHGVHDATTDPVSSRVVGRGSEGHVGIATGPGHDDKEHWRLTTYAKG
jgi:hypothetical protein